MCAPTKERNNSLIRQWNLQWERLLTLPGRGGANLAPPLTFLFVASKRMYMLVRNFLTFHKYQI